METSTLLLFPLKDDPQREQTGHFYELLDFFRVAISLSSRSELSRQRLSNSNDVLYSFPYSVVIVNSVTVRV